MTRGIFIHLKLEHAEFQREGNAGASVSPGWCLVMHPDYSRASGELEFCMHWSLFGTLLIRHEESIVEGMKVWICVSVVEKESDWQGWAVFLEGVVWGGWLMCCQKWLRFLCHHRVILRPLHNRRRLLGLVGTRFVFWRELECLSEMDFLTSLKRSEFPAGGCS